MEAHSCDYCRVFVLSFPSWLFTELRDLNTFNNTQSIDNHISLGCNLTQVEHGYNHGCALMQLLRTHLQDEIDFSSENLAAFRLDATCSITSAQWCLSFRVRTRNGFSTLKSAPIFYLCTTQGDLHRGTL